MSYFSYNSKKIYYEEHGSGEALVLLHGNTVSGKFFTPVIPILAEKYHVITLDFLGCGQSDRIDKWPADLWYEWSRQVMALCQELRLAKVKLIGCSGGALAALNLALEHPELVNAVAADSFEGMRADASVTGQIRSWRAYAGQIEGFRLMQKELHGEDWESVFIECVSKIPEVHFRHQKLHFFVKKPCFSPTKAAVFCLKMQANPSETASPRIQKHTLDFPQGRFRTGELKKT